MDTITHGIAGALLGKAAFAGDDMFTLRPMNRGRVVTWALMLGAIFPDADVFRDMLSRNPMLILTWHRSITHSLVCLPIFAALLAAITLWFARSRGWDPPSFAALTGIYAVGILSHILLDLVTTFGTMVWSPLAWSRPVWDLICIIDFTFSAILLVPQLLAWIYAKPETSRRRGLLVWLVSLPVPFVISKIATNVGTPIADATPWEVVVILSMLFVLAARWKFTTGISRANWNRAGVVAALAYIGLAIYAHNDALERVKKFAAFEHIEVNSLGALPLPPSVCRWDGLIRSPRGVYELRMDLQTKAPNLSTSLGRAGDAPVTYSFYPDAPDNTYIDMAKRLPEVETILWFSRFPVTRFRREGAESIVEIADLRFPRFPKARASAFTYQVRFDANGEIVSQGWAK